MNIVLTSPLYDSDFDLAAWLCMEAAALTDRDQFPAGSGDVACRTWHDRRKRFLEAREKRRRGATSLLELGLTVEDCKWAAEQARRAVDSAGWERRFRTALRGLQTADLQSRSQYQQSQLEEQK